MGGKAKLVIALCVAGCLVACSPPSQPEQNLVGKWQSAPPTNKADHHPQYQYEFLADGTVIRNEQIGGKWLQEATGTFKFVEQGRLKIALEPTWGYGVQVYELAWQDSDHVGLRAGDSVTQLARLK